MRHQPPGIKPLKNHHQYPLTGFPVIFWLKAAVIVGACMFIANTYWTWPRIVKEHFVSRKKLLDSVAFQP